MINISGGGSRFLDVLRRITKDLICWLLACIDLWIPLSQALVCCLCSHWRFRKPGNGLDGVVCIGKRWPTKVVLPELVYSIIHLVITSVLTLPVFLCFFCPFAFLVRRISSPGVLLLLVGQFNSIVVYISG